MKRDFNYNLDQVMCSKAFNAKMFTRQRYEDLVHRMIDLNSESAAERKGPGDYRRQKRFDVIHIGDTAKLIAKMTDANPTLRFYLCTDELFDVLHATHLRLSHPGRDKTMKELNKLYTNMTSEIVTLYNSLCEVCKKNRKVPNAPLKIE